MDFGVFSCPLMKGWCLLIYIENLVGLSTGVMEYKMWALNGLLDLLCYYFVFQSRGGHDLLFISEDFY